jgi:hypothetical protein
VIILKDNFVFTGFFMAIKYGAKASYSSYLNGEVQNFHFWETGDDALSGYTSSL